MLPKPTSAKHAHPADAKHAKPEAMTVRCLLVQSPRKPHIHLTPLRQMIEKKLKIRRARANVHEFGRSAAALRKNNLCSSSQSPGAPVVSLAPKRTSSPNLGKRQRSTRRGIEAVLMLSSTVITLKLPDRQMETHHKFKGAVPWPRCSMTTLCASKTEALHAASKPPRDSAAWSGETGKRLPCRCAIELCPRRHNCSVSICDST